MAEKFNEEGKTICQLCGKAFHVITPKHLERKHNITMKLYREQFPEFPITSKQFMAKQQRQRSTLFLEAEKAKEKEVEEVKEIIRKNEDFIEEGEPESKPAVEAEITPFEEEEAKTPKIEEVDFEGEPTPLPSKGEIAFMETSPQEKIDLILYLRGLFPDIKNNYVVVKKNFLGELVYQFITDMADPVLKVIFWFPRSFWHNENLEFTRLRDRLIEDEWNIIVINSRNPSVRDIEKALRSSDLINKVEQNTNY